MAYIERDIFINNELIPLVKTLDLCHPKQKKGVLMAISKLKEAPAADVVEVRHGEWVYNRGQAFGEPCYFCSLCIDGGSDNGRDNYCPNCGAKMDGKDRE